jgi:HSP20 family protein
MKKVKLKIKEDMIMLPTIVRRRNYATPSFLDEFFNDSYLPKFFDLDLESASSAKPAVNVEETDKEYRIEVAAPGLDKEDMKVSVDDGVLTISSEKKVENEDKNDNYIRREFGYTSFSRSFTLPEEVDAEKISAKHKNGVLHVAIPKAKVKVSPAKEIKIS